jgi:hypothetical protein
MKQLLIPCDEIKSSKGNLFLFMPVLTQAFFTLVRRHFVAFSFFSAWHDQLI